MLMQLFMLSIIKKHSFCFFPCFNLIYFSNLDFNLKYLQEHGFVKPVLFKDKAGLGMR